MGALMFARCGCPLRGILVACALGGMAFTPAGKAADESVWLAHLKNLTQAEGRTLLRLARDLFPHAELESSHYTRCIDPFDEAASDLQSRETALESLNLINGAIRRMGYTTYADISDEEERLRLAKMLAENRWIKRFSTGVGQCLYGQLDVKLLLKLK
ncbi:MAG: hypothetical protein U1F68_15815 [Gammaproteobacteria bacterium]